MRNDETSSPERSWRRRRPPSVKGEPDRGSSCACSISRGRRPSEPPQRSEHAVEEELGEEREPPLPANPHAHKHQRPVVATPGGLEAARPGFEGGREERPMTGGDGASRGLSWACAPPGRPRWCLASPARGRRGGRCRGPSQLTSRGHPHHTPQARQVHRGRRRRSRSRHRAEADR